MKKIITLVVFVALIAPNTSFAFENLFYYFDNTNGYSEYKKNYRDINILAPQIYEVDFDLKVDGPSNKKILKYSERKKRDVMPLLVNKYFDKVLMSDILINSNAQDEIIDFLIKEAKAKDYIGWQYDFENINHLDRDLYTTFVAKTYYRLKAENLKFSVAVVVRDRDYNPNEKNQDWSSAYDYKMLANYSDFLSLMTYDEPYSTNSPAGLVYVLNILNYLTNIVPAEKMSLGVPAYCWKWQESPRTKIRSLTYELAEEEYEDNQKIERGWNVFQGEFFKYQKDGIVYETWCDNDKSFEVKKIIAEVFGLRGISVWALGQADSGIWKVID